MLTMERIHKLWTQYTKKAEKYMEYYQQSGVAQYYAEYRRQDELRELCERAANNGSDHEDAVFYKSLLVTLGSEAFDAVHKNNLDDYRDVVKHITQIMRQTGMVRNRWE